MCQYFYFFNIYICTKRYHGMHKYQQVNFFSNVVKSVRPTYSNKEELAALIGNTTASFFNFPSFWPRQAGFLYWIFLGKSECITCQFNLYH